MPVIKITGNAETYQRMLDNMDFDASGPISGVSTLQETADALFDEIVEVCNGKMTKAEIYGFSDIAIDRVCRFI